MQVNYTNPSLIKPKQDPEDYAVYINYKKKRMYKVIQIILILPFIFQLLVCLRVGTLGFYLLDEFYQGAQAFWAMMEVMTMIFAIPYILDVYALVRVSLWLKRNS